MNKKTFQLTLVSALAITLLALTACWPAPVATTPVSTPTPDPLAATPVSQTTPTASPTAIPPTATPTASPTAILPTATTGPTASPTLPAPTNTPPPTAVEADDIRTLTILYTNDEHGWMEGMAPDQGAANLLGLWREVEGYRQAGPFLILSGGDMWTGPAISTWFQGQSMAEVMNEMGYAAAAIGNHEFDFGLESLRQRAAESAFPFLSANTRYRSTGAGPLELGIQPYTLIEVNGLEVGIIGLTTTDTPRTTNPVNVTEFEFIDYESALRETAPQVEAAGADLLVVAGHICRRELESLAGEISDLGIDMLGGGHCNELFAKEINDIIVVEGGSHLTSYARVTFQYNLTTDMVVDVDYQTATNEGGVADAAVEAIVNRWRAETEAELNVVIGYTSQGIERRSQQMQDMVTTSWLLSYPAADIAVINLGGFRASIPPGEITLADVIGVMPFDNTIIELQLTGAQLLTLFNADSRVAIGGMSWENGGWNLTKTGEAIRPDANYSLLVNSFMYAGGDGYYLLAEYDPHGYDTTIQWRQPFIDWIMAQNSDAANPLEETE